MAVIVVVDDHLQLQLQLQLQQLHQQLLPLPLTFLWKNFDDDLSLFCSSISHVCAGGRGWKFHHDNDTMTDDVGCFLILSAVVSFLSPPYLSSMMIDD